jgi:hypothetical protein
MKLLDILLHILPEWLHPAILVIAVIVMVLYLAVAVIDWFTKAGKTAAAAVFVAEHAAEIAKHLNNLRGRVSASEGLLRAPFSGRECIMYEVEIMRLGDEVISDRKVPSFIVEDENGRTLVYGQDIRLANEFELTLDKPDPKYKSVLEKLGVDYHDWEVYKVIRCQERCILPDQEVVLSGSFVYDDANPRILRPIAGTKVALKSI